LMLVLHVSTALSMSSFKSSMFYNFLLIDLNFPGKIDIKNQVYYITRVTINWWLLCRLKFCSWNYLISWGNSGYNHWYWVVWMMGSLYDCHTAQPVHWFILHTTLPVSPHSSHPPHCPIVFLLINLNQVL
jgi:hypothetical protein